MMARFSTSLLRRALMGVALSGLLGGSLLAGENQEALPAASTDPKTTETAPKSNPPGSSKDGLRRMEEDLFKPLKGLGTGGSLDGVLAPAPPIVRSAPTKKQKELLERRKNWEFLNPEDMAKPPSAEEMLNVPEFDENGQVKKKLSPLEQFFRKLEKESKGQKDPDKKRKSKKGDKDEADNDKDVEADKSTDDAKDLNRDDDRAYSSGSKDSKDGERLKKLFGLDSDTPKDQARPAPGIFSDIFGTADAPPERTLAQQKARTRDIQQLYGISPSSQSSSLGVFSPTPGLAPPSPAPSTLGSVPSYSRPNAFNSPFAGGAPTTPAVPTYSLPSFGGQTFSMPSLAPALPAAQMPSFNAPKRPF